jgi:hypothetical protein
MVGFSHESDDLLHYFNDLNVPGRIIDLDESAFDYTQRAELALIVMQAVNALYGDSHRRERLRLNMICWNAKRILGDIVFIVTAYWMASGHAMTAVFNGYYHLSCVAYAIVRNASIGKMSNVDIRSLLKQFVVMVYGDDIIMRTPDNNDWTFTRLLLGLRECGLNPTPASKTGQVIEYHNDCYTASFLKRRIMIHNDAVYLVRELDDIYHMLDWIKKKNDSMAFYIQIAEAMARDIAPYGDDEFERFLAYFEQVIPTIRTSIKSRDQLLASFLIGERPTLCYGETPYSSQ